jgi:hypothetical protein
LNGKPLTYPASRWNEFWRLHFLTLNQGRFVKRWHLVILAVFFFGFGISLFGEKFGFIVIAGRVCDALGDLLLDRGAGEL